MIMKKTYFSPVARYVDLHTESLMQTLSQIGANTDPSDPTVDDPNDAMTRRGGIWGWTDDK